MPAFCRCGFRVLEECINPFVVSLVWLGCGAFLLLRGCPLASCMHVFIAAISPIVRFSLLACVGFFQALDVFVPVPSLVSFLRSCWRFFFPSVFRLVPFWFPWRFWLWFWWFGSACSLKNSSNPSGALPCGVGGVRGGVVLCSFPLFLPKGGWVGVVGLAILLSNPKVSSGRFLCPVCGVLAGLLP